jgi:DNA-directed RNA polymerase specialized sigma24 family protein
MVLPQEDANSLVRRFVAGHPDAVDQIMRHYYGAMAMRAARLIHDYHIDEALFDRDDAVNVTLFKLWRAARDGKIPSIISGDDFWKLVCSSLHRNIRNARDYGERRKRGGLGASPLRWDSQQAATGADDAGARHAYHRRDANPNDLCSDSLPPDALTLANEEVERLLSLLHDPVLKSVASLRAEDYTIDEIAHRLGLTSRSIRRKLVEIRRIWSVGQELGCGSNRFSGAAQQG